MQGCRPLVVYGARLFAAKEEAGRMWVSAFEDNSVLTKRAWTPLPNNYSDV